MTARRTGRADEDGTVGEGGMRVCGEARLGMAGRGTARHGSAGRGKARHGANG